MLAGGRNDLVLSALKANVLCIDDDQAILRYEKMLLERSGYAVLTAASAQQGLRLVTMCECDAVLIDYEMPVMNGHEIASQIRRIRPEVTIILLSGSDVPTHVLPLFDAFVPKLEANRELLPLIAELCSRPPGPEPKQGFYPEDRR